MIRSGHFTAKYYLYLTLVLLLSSCLVGCLGAGFPIATDSPSDHFEIPYLDSHKQAKLDEIITAFGPPSASLRLDKETYLVYEAKSDADKGVVGVILAVPPFFVPVYAGEWVGGNHE